MTVKPGWCPAKVGEVGSVQLGRQRSPDVHTGSNMRPYLRVANVFEDRIDISDVMEMHFEPREVQRYELRPGDILLNEGQSRELVGRPAMYRGELPGACFTNSLVRFQPSEVIDGRFALLLFRHWMRSGTFQSISQITTNIAHLGAGRFSSLDVDLPPVAEQKRIVAKVEELTARSRRAKEALDAVPPLLDQLRQSILAAAFRGDLTADWRAKNPNVESVQSMLTRVPMPEGKGTGRAAGVQTRDGRAGLSVGPSERDPPNGWDWVPLGRVAKLESGHTPSRGSPSYWDGGIAWIGIKDAREHHGRVIAETLQTVSEEGLANSAARLLPARTVCLSRTASVGYVTIMGKSMATSQDFANWVCTPALLPEFLMYALLAEGEGLRKFGEGSTHTTIYYPELKALHIALPPLEEQLVVVRALEQRLQTLDRLTTMATGLIHEAGSMDPAILSKAFRGDLVRQDPDDEPASVLIDRIRAKRKAVQDVGNGSRPQWRHRASTEDPLDAPDAPGKKAPAPIGGTARAPAELTDPDGAAIHEAVVGALWTHGQLEKDDAARRVAEYLRAAGHVDFQRLRADGPLFGQVLDAIESAAKAGRLDRPKRGHVRACKPDATTYTPDDWRHALVASLGIDPVDRDDAIRTAAEWARENLGLEFVRLREDGHIVEGLRSALNSAIRRGDIVRHDARRISRAKGAPPSDPITWR